MSPSKLKRGDTDNGETKSSQLKFIVRYGINISDKLRNNEPFNSKEKGEGGKERRGRTNLDEEI